MDTCKSFIFIDSSKGAKEVWGVQNEITLSEFKDKLK